MRLRNVFTAFTIAALALSAVTLWTDVTGTGNAATVPGPFARYTRDLGGEEPSPTLGMAGQAAPPLLAPAPVSVSVQGFYAWALLDRKTGTMTGSTNAAAATNTTESMIKVWITADYLRRFTAAGPDQERLDELSRMIRDSDDAAAQDIYEADGDNAVVQRMVSVCGLTETSVVDGWWSRTQISARDAVRLGACLTDGRAAGPKWTSWVLGEMRQVRGEGRFGVVEALPTEVANRIPIKNGWTVVGDEWHVNCMAVVDRYVLAVLTRYPEELGLDYGAGICRSVTSQLRPRS
ncbi:serine hydrolase [Planosporangium mesophilum]|uniref:Serine hydrolase n=1 Tax=Planosporangium mesophilum TaxID=689768 RepID=A0A8J3TA88_9ACTN|nr:serine hydrolase [Planosporangium mesophilum]NJC82693.1 hypothetical protein [Planosporangium mesophilum]GII21841.1 hypothetical protein Pme01_14380 [Planosporangium mesophilum]